MAAPSQSSRWFKQRPPRLCRFFWILFGIIRESQIFCSRHTKFQQHHLLDVAVPAPVPRMCTHCSGFHKISSQQRINALLMLSVWQGSIPLFWTGGLLLRVNVIDRCHKSVRTSDKRRHEASGPSCVGSIASPPRCYSCD